MRGSPIEKSASALDFVARKRVMLVDWIHILQSGGQCMEPSSLPPKRRRNHFGEQHVTTPTEPIDTRRSRRIIEKLPLFGNYYLEIIIDHEG